MDNRKLKLCVLIPTHWEALMGGSQYQAKVLIDELIKLDRYEIYYLARRVKPGFVPEGYEIVKIGDPGGIGRYGHIFDSIKLLKALNSIKPDIIYHHVGCTYTGLAAYYCKKHRCKLVWHIASDVDVQPWAKKLTLRNIIKYVDKKILEYGVRHADYIIGQTEYQANQLKENYGRELSALVANFHPYPQEEIQKESPVKVVWVANFKIIKQPQVFIKLAQDLAKRVDARFIMVGSPATDQEWQKELDVMISSTPNLEYRGKLTQDQVNELFAKSHILVNTSEYEGFSNTFIQAWMRRVPVVGFNVNPDGLFDQSRLGNYSGGNYDLLCQQVARMVEDDMFREEIGMRAQEYAFEKFSEKNMIKLLEFLK